MKFASQKMYNMVYGLIYLFIISFLLISCGVQSQSTNNNSQLSFSANVIAVQINATYSTPVVITLQNAPSQPVTVSFVASSGINFSNNVNSCIILQGANSCNVLIQIPQGASLAQNLSITASTTNYGSVSATINATVLPVIVVNGGYPININAGGFSNNIPVSLSSAVYAGTTTTINFLINNLTNPLITVPASCQITSGNNTCTISITSMYVAGNTSITATATNYVSYTANVNIINQPTVVLSSNLTQNTFNGALGASGIITATVSNLSSVISGQITITFNTPNSSMVSFSNTSTIGSASCVINNPINGSSCSVTVYNVNPINSIAVSSYVTSVNGQFTPASLLLSVINVPLLVSYDSQQISDQLTVASGCQPTSNNVRLITIALPSVGTIPAALTSIPFTISSSNLQVAVNTTANAVCDFSYSCTFNVTVQPCVTGASTTMTINSTSNLNNPGYILSTNPNNYQQLQFILQD